MPPTATRAASGCQVARISSLNDVPAAPALSSLPPGPSFTLPLAPTPPRAPLAAADCIIRSLFALPPSLPPPSSFELPDNCDCYHSNRGPR